VSRRYLPRFYLEGFAEPDPPTGEAPSVWVYRAPIGEWKRAAAEPAPGGGRHFNDMEGEAEDGGRALDETQRALEPEAARVFRERLPARGPLVPEERSLLASFFALLAVRLSPRFAGIDEGEAMTGARALASVLSEMGWVFWEAQAPGYFITSSSPFLVAFPSREEELFANVDLHSPSTEVTLPLAPRLALHATWKRKGEVWRRASEDALLELNGRTCQRARHFLVSPRPAVPG
jgi:hypothetical protein